MAYLTSPSQIYGLNPQDTSSRQQHALGAFGYDKIGRKYVYVLNGAVALVKGHLLQSPARDTAFTDMAVTSAVAAGATSIPVTLGGTAITAGQFNDGILTVTASTGLGQNFIISGHTVTGAAGAAVFNLDPGEVVLTALATSSKVTVTRGAYNGVIDSPTARTGKSVGVALSAIPASTATVPQFGFIGTTGEFGVLSDATVAAVGEAVSPSTGTAGAVTKQVTLLENIGTAGILGVSAEYQPVVFKL